MNSLFDKREQKAWKFTKWNFRMVKAWLNSQNYFYRTKWFTSWVYMISKCTSHNRSFPASHTNCSEIDFSGIKIQQYTYHSVTSVRFRKRYTDLFKFIKGKLQVSMELYGTLKPEQFLVSLCRDVSCCYKENLGELEITI